MNCLRASTSTACTSASVCCGAALVAWRRPSCLRSSSSHIVRGLSWEAEGRGNIPSQRLDPSTSTPAPGRPSRRFKYTTTNASPDMLLPRYSSSTSRRESLDRTPLLGPSAPSKLLSPQQQQDDEPRSFSWQWLVGLCALSVVICYADRSNISTAILPMSEAFSWDKGFQGVVLSSFFLGYALTQMLGGNLADRYGGKIVLGGGVALWSLFTAAIPASAAAGTATLLATRVLLGVGEGVAFPAIHSLIARNVPYANQSTAVGIVTAASYAGTALAFGVSPWIITNFGWPAIFYSFAALALIWLPMWAPVQVKPQQRSAAALLDTSNGSGSPMDTESAALSVVPAGKGAPLVLDRGFWALLKRKEVWAICIAQYTGSWGMYGLLNWLPTFFSEYYQVQIEDLAAYTLLPYIVQGGLGAFSGYAADTLIARGWSVKQVRIALQVLGMLGPAACLLLAVSPVVGDSAAMASSLITVGLGFSALTLGGVSTSHLDIAPKHAGAVFGAGNTAGCLAGFISVPVTGFLLQATGSWPLVFGITAAHYVVGAVFWSMWVGDKVLPEDEMDEAVPALKA